MMADTDGTLPSLTQPLPGNSGQNTPAGAPPLPLPAATPAAPGATPAQSLLNTLTTPNTGNTPADSSAPAAGDAPANAAAGHAYSGTTLKIDLAAMSQVISGWQDVQQKLADAYRNGTWLTQIQNPGTDQGSYDFANAANSVGSSHQQANEALQDAVTAHIQNLTAAVQRYQATDEGNAGNVNRQDS